MELRPVADRRSVSPLHILNVPMTPDAPEPSKARGSSERFSLDRLVDFPPLPPGGQAAGGTEEFATETENVTVDSSENLFVVEWQFPPRRVRA